MITSDFAALNDTVQFGTKVHTSGVKWGKENTFGDSENTDLYVDAILLGENSNVLQSKWAKNEFNWKKVGNQWNEVLINL
jgi:hypothetical protein